MVKKKKQDSITKIENSEEFRNLVNQSITEMENMIQVAEDAGMDPETAKNKVASMYVRNLQQTDELASLAKKNIAELMTRIQLDRALNREEDLVSDKYIQLFRLQNEALRLLKSLEPKSVKHMVQVQDDKMFFDIKDGVYEEK